MKVAVYTLTRDRLDYTKRAFDSLATHAGHPYDHFVVDNGSVDGTQEWLQSGYQSKWTAILKVNRGISIGSNLAIERILSARDEYDLVVKMDNDCLVITPGIIAQLVAIYNSKPNGLTPINEFALGPRVQGLAQAPTTTTEFNFAGYSFRHRCTLGGIFLAVPRHILSRYRYPETLPMAWGQDDAFCEWLRISGYFKAQVDELVVEHMEMTDGQARRYPAYFDRKRIEEKTPPSTLKSLEVT